MDKETENLLKEAKELGIIWIDSFSSENISKDLLKDAIDSVKELELEIDFNKIKEEIDRDTGGCSE